MAKYTKDDVKEALDDKGIAYNNRDSKETLEALLPEGVLEELQGVEPPATPPADPPAGEEGEAGDPPAEGDEPKPEAPVVSTKGSVTAPEKGAKKVDVVRVHEEGEVRYVRTYSEERHGKDFMNLAKSFIEGAKSKRNQVCKIAKHNSNNPAIV